MLQISNAYIDKKVLSLHNGAVIGRALQPIINPENLKIEGWFTDDKLTDNESILLTQDVREYSKKGFIVNSHDSLTDPNDLVRLKKVLDIRFELVGKKVLSENKHRLGTVVDYAVDSQSMFIKKLYVDPPIIKSLGLSRTQIIIDRSQIIEITNQEIIVRDTSEKVSSRAPLAAGA